MSQDTATRDELLRWIADREKLARQSGLCGAAAARKVSELKKRLAALPDQQGAK